MEKAVQMHSAAAMTLAATNAEVDSQGFVTMRRRAICAAIVLLATSVTMTGCSTSAGPAPESGPTDTRSGPTQDELSITLRDGSGSVVRWRLTCRPPGGDHPDPERACRALEQHGERALPAVPKDRSCIQVYGGPETATITGTWRGQPVLSRLSRVDGCEISRWDALLGLLPPGGS